MTLSPEERAREVVRSLMEPLDNGKSYLETPMRTVMAEVIATAIREAENAALERAVLAVEDAGGDNEVYHAEAIRTLKHPKD